MRAAVAILCTFATLWFAFAVYATGSHLWLLYVVAILVSLSLFLGVPKGDTSPSGSRRHRRRVIGIASGAEVLAIFAAFLILSRSQQSHWGAPVVAAIVGVHFIAMARYLPYAPYYLAAAAFIGLAGAGVAIDVAGFGDAASQITVGGGAASVLWLTSAVIVRDARHRAAA